MRYLNPIPTRGGRFCTPLQRLQLNFPQGYVPAGFYSKLKFEDPIFSIFWPKNVYLKTKIQFYVNQLFSSPRFYVRCTDFLVFHLFAHEIKYEKNTLKISYKSRKLQYNWKKIHYVSRPNNPKSKKCSEIVAYRPTV